MTDREGAAIAIDVGVGIVGFALSILWGRVTRSKMTTGKIRMLMIVWVCITVFAIAMIPVMRHVK